MTATTKTKVETLIAQAREYDRRGDVTLRNQTIRSIEGIPGVSRKMLAAAKAKVFASSTN